MAAPIFETSQIPKITFGAGAVERLGEAVAQLGASALLIHNTRDEALAARVRALISRAGLRAPVHRQRGEPLAEAMDDIADRARGENVDVIVGMGGGSAIDAAKAVAGLAANDGKAMDYLEVIGKGAKLAKAALPWIAVPMTAGSGAEVTRNAVLGSAGQPFKASLRSEMLIAQRIIVDPALAASMGPAAAAASGLDALCQCIEAHLSNKANAFTDAHALAGIDLAVRALPLVAAEPDNLLARADMAMAALHGGIALANAGLGVVHGLAAPMGALFAIPHGVICARLLPHALRANIAAAQALAARLPSAEPAGADAPRAGPLLARFASLGRRLARDPHLSAVAALEACGRTALDLVEALAVPSLASFGLSAEDAPRLADLCAQTSSFRYNPIPLTKMECGQIVAAAL